MHTIHVDSENALVEVRITGFWTTDDVAAFGRDLLAATTVFLATGRSFNTFYDYSEAIIQPQAVVAAFQTLALSTIAHSRRAALFTENGMARQQARRIAAVRPDMAVFDDRAAAMAWLMEEEAAAAPAPLRRAAR